MEWFAGKLNSKYEVNMCDTAFKIIINSQRRRTLKRKVQ